MKPYYVVGHKNPDCDAIVSAIAYAQLKRKLGMDAIACAQGTPNLETQYLLKKYHFEHPKMIHSAKCTLAEIEKDDPLLAPSGLTMKEALDAILERKNKGIFVTEEDGKLIGLVSMSDLTRLWTHSEESLQQLMRTITIDNALKVLSAKVYHREKKFHTSGVIHIMPSMSDNVDEYKDSIVILRNNPDVQRFAIDAGASLIIVSGEDWVDSVTLSKAKEKHVSIILTQRTVLECSRLIYQAPSVDVVLTKDVISFHQNETVEDVSAKLAKTRYRTYPVLDDEGKVVAAISRYHLFNYEKKRFILVDHNEVTQSVDDIEFAEICEIVDHHRMGGIETVNPINIIERVIGSTASIVTSLYRDKNVPIDKNTAGILLGALLMDTLCLRSPTTTNEDREIASYLSKIAEITIEQLNDEMINATDSILNKTDIELMYDDFKEFRISGNKVGIGQCQCKKWEDYFEIKDRFLKFVSEVAERQHFELILFMFTDPVGTGSQFLYTGKKSRVIEDGFHDVLNENGFAKGIISRKKQVLPVIIATMEK